MMVCPSTFARLAVLVLAVLALTLAASHPAAAHGMDYALRGSGEMRIVFRYTSGPPMIGAPTRVFEPGGDAPVATGVTDSAGEFGFRATRDGQWRIEASDSTGQAIRARIEMTDGVPMVASRRIPNWLAAGSLALNILLIAGFAFGRRMLRAPHREAGRRTQTPTRPATSSS